MHRSTASRYTCTRCGDSLELTVEESSGEEIAAGTLRCVPCALTVPIQDGVPRFSDALDRRGNSSLNYADSYEANAAAQMRMFGTLQETLTSLAERLQLKPGYRMIDLACGTGSLTRQLIRDMHGQGELFVTDVSTRMLEHCQKRMQGSGVHVEAFQADLSEPLPLQDDMFDVLYHSGSFNMLRNKARILADWMRVLKPGGRLVMLDEGIAPWLLDTPYGRRAMRIASGLNNPADLPREHGCEPDYLAIAPDVRSVFKFQPPVWALPGNAAQVRVEWPEPSRLLWLLTCVKGSEPELAVSAFYNAQVTLGEALERAARVTVKVQNDRGRAVRGLNIRLIADGWSHIFGAGTAYFLTDRDGIVTFPHVIPGRYRVHVYGDDPSPLGDAFDVPVAETVTLTWCG